jgi:tetratricopeptide (TPR) repeat protein
MASLAASAGARGDHVQQLQLLERAMRLDPAAFNLHNNVIGVKLAIGDLAGAEASLRVLAERFPELEDQRLQLSAVVALARGNGDEVMRLTKAAQAAPVTRDNIDARLATSVLFSGHAEEALPMLERALANGSVTRTGRPPLVALLGYLKWQSGDRTRADSLFAAAIDASRRGSQPLAGAEYLRASIAATRGQNEEALQRLDRAVRAGWDGWMTGRFNPMFNGLHGNPRYEALMAEVKAKLDRQRAEAKRLGL